MRIYGLRIGKYPSLFDPPSSAQPPDGRESRSTGSLCRQRRPAFGWHTKQEQEAGVNTLYLKSVAGVLHPNVAIVEPTATIQQAACEMVRQHRSNALVMDGEELLGIITDRDMTKRVIAQGRDFTDPVTTVMTAAPCTIDADAPLVRAVEVMMQQNVRSLPVVEGGKLKVC